MNEKETQPVEQVSWNLSEVLLMEISGLLQSASTYYIRRNLGRCAECLMAVKNRIVQHLSSEERKDFQKKEDLILIRVSMDHSIPIAEANPKMHKKNRNKLFSLLTKYNEKLMDTLEKYGYLIGKKEDAKRAF